MKCLEFKQLALSDPHSNEVSFVEHSQHCVECLKYVESVRQMDADLADSVSVSAPADLAAKLQLKQLLDTESAQRSARPRYAIAASIIVALVVGGFLLKNQFALEQEVGVDHQRLLAGVMEHLEKPLMAKVLNAQAANQQLNTMLASYDSGLRFKHIDNLQFGRICPMGEYRGLHASLETEDGPITFAYIKGAVVYDLLDARLDGYVARVKPLREGNLIIISPTQQAMEKVDNQLSEAAYWDI